jgi:hypothetical protein
LAGAVWGKKTSSKLILDKGAGINLYGAVWVLDFVNHLWAFDYENQVTS